MSQPFQRLKQDGWDVTVLPVDAFGRVDPESVEAALRPDTVRVSLMHANSEIGAIQPIAEIANFTRPRGILLHTENKRRAPWCRLAGDSATLTGGASRGQSALLIGSAVVYFICSIAKCELTSCNSIAAISFL